MSWNQCPLCFDPLEVCDVAPCEECGALPTELDHFHEGRHTYQRLRVFRELALELTMCNFCMVDFGSFRPEFFGLPPRARIGFQYMQLVRDVVGEIGRDKFCSACGYRLAFLEFVASARELFSAEHSS